MNEWAKLGLSKEKLVRFAVSAEKASGVEGGIMDQICIIHAKKQHALLIQCSDWNFKQIFIPEGPVSWLVVDTKVKHQLIHTDYNKRSRACQQLLVLVQSEFPEVQSLSDLEWSQIRLLEPKCTQQQFNYLVYIHEENQRVLDVIEHLERQNFQAIGNSLFSGHEGLRKLYKVSCDELDFLVDYAAGSGVAYGARMMGGGFGGASLHLIPKHLKENYWNGIMAAYRNRFGFFPDVFEVQFEDGIHFL